MPDWNGKRAQDGPSGMSVSNGMILCEERLKPKHEREKSPTREAWQRNEAERTRP